MRGARELVALAIECAEPDVPETTAIGSFDQWDSLAHIRLFAALEAELGRELTSLEAAEICSVAAVQAVLDGSKNRS